MISPTMAFQLLQILPGVVGKLTGKEKDAKILSTILSLPKLAEMFKDPSIGDKLKKTPDKEGVPAPKIPKDKDTVSSGRYTSGIGNLLQIDPDKLNLWRPPIRSISPLSGINNLFESSW